VTLQIANTRERTLVRAADAALGLVSSAARPFSRRARPHDPTRILLLRLERIGDLLMALPAIRDVRAFAPSADIDLVVGRWNTSLAEAIPSVSRVITLDAKWLARDTGGLGMRALLGAARGWRGAAYDLAINFEPDIRSNLLLGASGAAWTVGWASGGGGPILDQALDFDPKGHTIENARRLVSAAFGHTAPLGTSVSTEAGGPVLAIPDAAEAAAAERLLAHNAMAQRLVGVHASGGRPIKQWDPERFADVAEALVRTRGATIVLTGTSAERALIETVRRRLPATSVIDASGDLDLLELAALLRRMDLFITGDTGPMHLAAAVETPIVAVFGPSAPHRYAPAGPLDRIVRVDLPCSPCNRIRQPPARCVGHTPDCLVAVSSDAVLAAAHDVLDRRVARLTHPLAVELRAGPPTELRAGSRS
jgi:heptosyltransferase-2